MLKETFLKLTCVKWTVYKPSKNATKYAEVTVLKPKKAILSILKSFNKY